MEEFLRARTTPYHFVGGASAATAQPSGVALRHTRLQGRTYLQTSAQSHGLHGEAKAKTRSAKLTELARRRGTYQVADSDPSCRDGQRLSIRGGDQRERISSRMRWFQHQNEWAAIPPTRSCRWQASMSRWIRAQRGLARVLWPQDRHRHDERQPKKLPAYRAAKFSLATRTAFLSIRSA